jgi:hypothetical protein
MSIYLSDNNEICMEAHIIIAIPIIAKVSMSYRTHK